MTEQYYWWWNGVKRLSRAEIRKMKENMQKTPLVQEKSNRYHRLEEEKAEKLLTSLIGDNEKANKHETISKEKKEIEKKLGLISKIKKYLFW